MIISDSTIIKEGIYSKMIYDFVPKAFSK